MRQKPRFLSHAFVLALSCLGGWLAGAPPTAEAHDGLYHASICNPDNAQRSWGFDTSGQEGGNSSFTNLLCPMTSDGDLPASAVTVLQVFGYDPSTTADVNTQACVTFWSGTSPGGTCGPTVASATSAGNFYVQLDRVGTNELTVWQNYYQDLPYVLVGVGGSGTLDVFGYYVHD